MPQPLHLQCSLEEGPQIFQERKDLAAHIAAISALFNHLDFLLGLLLAEILGAQWEPALDMYMVLRGAKEEALEAAAMKRLSETDQQVLLNIVRLYRERARERNSVVHGMWFISDKYPDGLIHTEASHYYRTRLSVFAPKEGTLRFNYLHPSGISVPARVPHYRLWKKGDFAEVEARINEAITELGNFKTHIRESRQPSQQADK